jgi:hypothetical protein
VVRDGSGELLIVVAAKLHVLRPPFGSFWGIFVARRCRSRPRAGRGP